MKQHGDQSGSKAKEADRTVNIKIIETHKVHTDVTHFKSVVQCLTGKDSVVGKTSERSSSSQGVQVQQKSEEGGREGKGEFDDILKMKLPSLDELKEFWDD